MIEKINLSKINVKNLQIEGFVFNSIGYLKSI